MGMVEEARFIEQGNMHEKKQAKKRKDTVESIELICGTDEYTAKKFLEAICDGMIPNVKFE